MIKAMKIKKINVAYRKDTSNIQIGKNRLSKYITENEVSV